MAFFELGKRLQVILIASGLAVAPAGCKPPGDRPPQEPTDKKVSKGSCKALDIAGIEVMVTRAVTGRATLALKLKGTIPDGTELEQAVAGEGIEVVRSAVGEEGILTVEIKHEGLEPGEIGTLLVDVKTTCGNQKATYRDRISICKQAGGVKILEGADTTCQGVAPQPDAAVVVDPVPYPVDPPPPPPDPVPHPVDPLPPPPDPVPPPNDPVPYPYDPAPVPQPPSNKDPAPQPFDAFIVDCVPDAMGPSASLELEAGAGHASDVFQPKIIETRLGDGVFELRIVDRLGGDPGGMDITWSCSAGVLETTSGPRTRWTSPHDGSVQAVMAVVEKGGLQHIETWKMIPARDGG